MKCFLAFILGITVCYVPAKMGQAELSELVDKAEHDVLIAKAERDEAVERYTAVMNGLPIADYLGEFKVTYYCPCSECSGQWGTALAHPCSDNHEALAQHSIAVDPKVIPIGSVVMMNGKYYTAEDVGSAVVGKTVDVFVETHDEVIKNGLDYEDVFLITLED